MKTIKLVTDRDVESRVKAIKRTWSKAERDARHVEAEKRQQKLASILGLKVVRADGSTLHCAT